MPRFYSSIRRGHTPRGIPVKPRGSCRGGSRSYFPICRVRETGAASRLQGFVSCSFGHGRRSPAWTYAGGSHDLISHPCPGFYPCFGSPLHLRPDGCVFCLGGFRTSGAPRRGAVKIAFHKTFQPFNLSTFQLFRISPRRRWRSGRDRRGGRVPYASGWRRCSSACAWR